MSEASSEHSAGGTRHTGEQLVQRLQRRAGSEAERFSLTSHLAAGRALVRLRDALLAGEALSQRAELTLLCVGIALRRRWLSTQSQMSEDDSADTKRDAEDSLELLRGSVNLIFVLLCVVERRRANQDAEEAARQIEAFQNTPVWKVLAPPSRKRAREGEAGEEAEGEAEGEAGEGAPTGGEANEGGWARALRLTAADVARMTLTVGAARVGAGGDGGQAEELALLHFRAEAASMATRLLMPSPRDEYVSLGTKRGDESVPRAKRLLAIAQAGESEAGQSILRDMVLSWLLPPRLVGVRRGLLLSRATSTAAGVDWPLAVQRAHDVACALHTQPSRARGRAARNPHASSRTAQDGRLRVHLAERHQRARAHVLPADRPGHPHHQGRRRPHPQARRLQGARVAAVVRDGRAQRRQGAAPDARARGAQVDRLHPWAQRVPARREHAHGV